MALFLHTSNTHTHLVAVHAVHFGHPSIRAGCVGVGLWLWGWRWAEVRPTNGAGLKSGAVPHVPLARELRNHCTASIQI